MQIRTLALLAAAALLPGAANDEWKPLFNGKDLSGWETWLGKPHKSVDVSGARKDDKGNYLDPVGLNQDPKGVYRVVEADGQPAIRISGEIWGALTTQEEFENYHLSFEFKWGEKRWAPRDNTVRDSGCLYHCVGAHGAGSGFWMKSFEIQVQEKDCGDFHSVAGVLVDVEAAKKDPAAAKSELIYRKGAPKLSGVARRVIKDADHEKPRGEWNTLEVYCLGQTAVHVVNGKTVLVLTGLRHKVDGKEVPLTKGRIQFQSESAEVYYRNIKVRPITEIPKTVLEPQ